MPCCVAISHSSGCSPKPHALSTSSSIVAGASNTLATNELALQVKMSDAFALSFGVGVRMNTDPPAGAKKTDTLTTINLVYGFK